METINDELELALALVLKSLESIQGIKINSSAVRDSNVLKVDSLKENVEYTTIAVQLEKDEECIVSMFKKTDKRIVESYIFEYKCELNIPINLIYPLSFAEYCKLHNVEEVLTTISNIFMGKVYGRNSDDSKDVERQSVEVKRPEGINLEREPGTTKTTSNRPSDMPKFDDEYEIINQNEEGYPDRYPGLNLPEKLGSDSKLGNPDLYPMGKKDPFNFNEINSQGGLTFDPFGKNQSNMRGDLKDLRERGPGWMPGSKYDDPFGGVNSGGMNPPGPNGFGSGSGSGSGAGSGMWF